tara:strand:+ start:368 stop:844 length:477 start_codon:yes stop_codon:yes gene_type:complete
MRKNIYIIIGIGIIAVVIISLNFASETEESIPELGTNESVPTTDETISFGISTPLFSQSDSGQVGGIDLVEIEKKVEVTVQFENVVAGIPHPVHLHSGSCDSLGNIVFPLNSIVDGSSKTTLGVSVKEFQSQLPLAINVHKAENELGVNIACGFVSEQ